MEQLLNDLASLPGVRGSLLISRDGLVIGSRLGDAQDPDEIAVMGATVFGALDRAAQQVGLGQVVDSIVQTTSYSVQVLGAGDVVLVVIADKGMNVAEVRREMRNIANQLASQGLA